MKTLTIALLLALTGAASAQQRTFYDAAGRQTGRAVTNNVGHQYYDASGRNTGRSTTNSTGTTFYDSMGRQTGRATTSGRSR